VRPALGRGFLAEEVLRATPVRVTVLGHGLGSGGSARSSIVGKDVELQGLPFRVIGVLPEKFTDISRTPALCAVTVSRLTQREGYVEDRLVRWMSVFARLRPGVTAEQARRS